MVEDNKTKEKKTTTQREYHNETRKRMSYKEKREYEMLTADIEKLTEQPFEYIDSLQGSITKGIGMDFDKRFTHLKAHKITGIIPVKE